MKKTEKEKPKFPFLVDVRDYISNSMIIKNNYSISNQADKDFSVDTCGENTEKSRPFDLFAHILEG